MVTIAGNPYGTGSLQYNSYDKAKESSVSGLTSKNASDSKLTSPASLSGDKVSLSDEVEAARTRESMGLSPTGPLRLNDFKSAFDKQALILDEKLGAKMKEQGLSGDQELTLGLDTKKGIVIKENFSGKAKLEKALNEDKDFVKTFNAYSSTSGVLDYVKGLKEKMSSTNLSDFMDSDPDWGDIMTLASKYSDLKSSANPLALIAASGRNQASYVYGSGNKS